MRIISRTRLKDFWRRHPDAKGWLERWHAVAKKARWRKLADVRRAFPQADTVTVRSRRPVTIFDVSGDKYRLITAIHYNTGALYVLLLLTHAEYNKDQWKGRL